MFVFVDLKLLVLTQVCFTWKLRKIEETNRKKTWAVPTTFETGKEHKRRTKKDCSHSLVSLPRWDIFQRDNSLYFNLIQQGLKS